MMTSIKKEDPLSFRDMKILRACLQTIGAWPTEAFGEKSRRIYLSYFFVMTTILVAFGQVNYLSKNLHTLTFFEMGDYVMIVCLTALAFVRTLLAVMKGYGTILTHFFRNFHLIHFKHKGEYYEKIYKKIDFLSHYFVWFLLFIMVVGFVFFNYNATYDNYSNGAFSDEPMENYTLQFSINYIYPGFNPENYLLTTSFINLFLSYVTSNLICAIDSLLYLMAFHLYGHIKVLKYDLQHMARPKRTFIIPHGFCRDQNIKTNLLIEKYDTQENSIIREKIVEYVKHYELIISFAGDVSRFFGPMVAFNYLYQLLGCGVLLLQLSLMDPQALARYGPVAIVTFGQLIEISVIFEIVRAESMKLKDAAYEMPWECMNISNQKLVCMFLCRIQVPIRFTALGMVDIGVQTMTWILKTTLSYFALLKSMNT